MEFKDILNDYIARLQCNAKDLVEMTGLSAANISRYRNGDRVPNMDSPQLKALTTGIVRLSEQKNSDTILTIDEVTTTLTNAIISSNQHFDLIVDNLNTLINVLHINISELARFLNYDASFISRIRSKQRHPYNENVFIDKFCNFLVRRYKNPDAQEIIIKTIGCSKEVISNKTNYIHFLKQWIITDNQDATKQIGSFLKKMDDFNLVEYIRSIHFDDIKVPTLPFQLTTHRNYYGLEEMKNGELDFLKSTVLSKSKKPIFMCSDMPMEDMAQDIEFSKKWMFGLAVVLKKGLHINIIHNLNRPFQEMMLGLESWIPLYMTGQISPYYIKQETNTIYNHLHYVSGEVTLFGECISGFHDKGRYYLTRNKEEVAHYQEITNCLFKKSSPLMKIYREASMTEFQEFLQKDATNQGKRHSILSALPIYTLSDELLSQILTHNHIEDNDMIRIKNYTKQQKAIFSQILQNNTILDTVPNLTKEEFEAHPMLLSLSGMFYEKDIIYNYEEYLSHLEITKHLADTKMNYSIQLTNQSPFRNIQIVMLDGKWAMISKNKYPSIHFVISHPKLCHSLEHMVMPIFE